MAFSWYDSDLPPQFVYSPEKATQMYLHELHERASLLLRLGYSREAIITRLRGNLKWDFELHAPPEYLHRIQEIVDKIIATRRSGQSGPPSVD